MQIRPATAADAESLTSLINLAYQVEHYFIESDRITKTGVEQRIEAGCMLLAENASGISGCIYFEIRGDRGYFGLLAVHPELQGKGLGHKLIAEVENYARNAQCRFMDIQVVDIRLDLSPFYYKLGYRETGISPYEKADTSKLPCHFINMTKVLD